MATDNNKKKKEIVVADDEIDFDTLVLPDNEEIVVADDDVMYVPDDQVDYTPEVDVSGVKAEVPAGIRFELSGLSTMEDKKRALEKNYTRVEQVGDDNFVMFDPASGKDILLNQTGWMPSWGDVVEFVPEIAGITGGAIGGALGGLGAGAAGSVVPVAGTAAGLVAGGVAGSGAGYATGKNALQAGINWAYGNDDTRDLGEYAKDVAIDAAVGAAGEGIGRGVSAAARYAGPKIVQAVGNPLTRAVVGKADDPALAAARRGAYEAVDVQPTPGMIGGSNVAAKELGVARNSAPRQAAIQNVDDQLANRWENAVADYVGDIDPSSAGAGTAMKDAISSQAANVRNTTNQMYNELGRQTDGVVADSTNLTAFGKSFKDEFAKAGANRKLNIGPSYDAVIKQTDTLLQDIAAGGTFNTLKEARTSVNALKSAASTPSEKHMYTRLAEAITGDMEATAAKVGDDTLKLWKDANRHYTSAMDKTNPAGLKQLDKLVAKDTPDAIFSVITSNIKKDGQKVRDIMRQVHLGGGDDAVREVGANVISRLGMKGGKFDANKLVTEWDALKPEAKAAFLPADPAKRKSFDNIIAAIKQTQEFKSAGKNTSFTQKVGDGIVGRAIDKATGLPATAATGLTAGITPAITLGMLGAARGTIRYAKESLWRNEKTLNVLAGLARGGPKTEARKTLEAIAATATDGVLKAHIRDFLYHMENER